MNRNPCVVITDLDNTLYDWVEVWYQSFTRMMNYLVDATGIPREQLLDEARAVHQQHGTSEYAFVAYELPSLREHLPNPEFLRIAENATRICRDVQKQTLCLYPGVQETLLQLREQNVLIIGYTESMTYYSAQRVIALELDGLLHYLYSSMDHAMPIELDFPYPKISQEPFRETIHSFTPQGELKPNPLLLQDIIRNVGAVPDQVIYVGDSLLKDVVMAQEAGVTDVLAAYGKAQDRAAYELLRRVTHWTNEDVMRERAILARGEVIPTYVLQQSFAELLEMFEFAAVPVATQRCARVEHDSPTFSHSFGKHIG